MPASDSAASHLATDSERAGRWPLTMAWWSLCSAMFYIFVAASLAIAFGAVNAIVGMVITVFIYGAVNYPLVKYASRTGASTTLVSQLAFGRQGSALATVLLGLTAVYYAVFEGSVLAIAVTKVFPAISYGWACLLVVAYSAPLVIGSVQVFLSRLNSALLPLYLGGLALLVIFAGRSHGFSGQWLELGGHEFSWFATWQCIVSYMGIWVLMMVTVDFARLSRPADARYHALFSFGAPFYAVTFLINGVAGIFLVGTVQAGIVTEVAVVDATILVLGGTIALLFIWATQTRINSINFYVAVSNLQSVVATTSRLRMAKWIYVAIIAILVLALMISSDVFSSLLLALQIQGIFITAWVGVILPFVLRDRRTPAMVAQELAGASGINAGNLIAWAAGTIAGLLAMKLPGGYSSLTGIASFVVAAAVQLAASSRNRLT